MPKSKSESDERPPKEAAERRDAALRNMLKSPPKPHKDSGDKSKKK